MELLSSENNRSLSEGQFPVPHLKLLMTLPYLFLLTRLGFDAV